MCSSFAKPGLSNGEGVPISLSTQCPQGSVLRRTSNKLITCVFSFSTTTFLYLEIINFN